MSKPNGGTALYRLYRSRKFEDVVGQEHVTTTLANAVKQGRLSHAYLFVGPRGVGKTSVARILAHAVNELPYDGQSNHLDVVEIDAASNRGIDEIRDLREKVHLAPTSAKYKVYIIDEVHMLTTPAFSALLKTLEEPPAHVIFVLATTEGHKLPPTIISRTQRFTFLPIAPEQATRHLAEIAKREKLKIQPQALELIAYHGFGSLRDSLGLLDQLSAAQTEITAESVGQLIGLAPQQAVDALLAAVRGGQADTISDIIDDIRAQGVSPALLARQLIDELRRQEADLALDDIALFNALLEVASAGEPELKLEAVLLEYCLRQAAPAGNVTAKEPVKSATAKAAPEQKPVEPAAEPADDTDNPATELSGDDWQAILLKVKDSHNSLYAILRQARALSQDGNLLLQFKFEFHRKRVSEDKNRRVIEQTAATILGRPATLKTSLNSQLALPAAPASQTDNMASVINLMGGGDVMEL